MRIRGRVSKRGSALVFALITVMFVASAGAAYLQFTTSAGRTQVATVENRQAFYVAEAGLAEAFRGVRLGRTGTVGSPAAPASFGQGLVWVEAIELPGGQVQLTSTGMVGRGKASLSYVLQPTESNLGVYSAEEMVIDDVILIDGYDSEKGSYQDQIPTETHLAEPIPEAAQDLLSELSSKGIPKGSHLGYSNWSEEEEEDDEDDDDLDLSKLLSGSGGYAGSSMPLALSDLDVRNLGIESEVALWRAQLDTIYEQARLDAQANGEAIPMRPPIDNHTGEKGILGSGAGIVFELEAGEIPEVYGDVYARVSYETPEGSALSEALEADVSGRVHESAPRIDLPKVQVPTITTVAEVVHSELLPLTIASGDSGYASLTVEADAEVIIRGPATVVVGQLTLMPGATLTLDTRSGEIDLFVTQGMDLKPGSATLTTPGPSQNLELQVAAIPSVEGEPAPVHLDATSQFHGTIYAPETEVYVGSNFEVFGRVMARKLSFGPGAKLHVDHAGTQGTSIPEIVSWRIAELPTQIQGRGRDAYDILGVDSTMTAPLTESHDLANVTMQIAYTDLAGNAQTYNGLEAGFPWDDVREVASVERVPNRSAKSGIGFIAGGGDASASALPDPLASAAAPPPLGKSAADTTPAPDPAAEEKPAEETTAVRDSVDKAVKAGIKYGLDGVRGYAYSKALEYIAPLSAEEWALVATTKSDLSDANYQRIIDAHVDKGGDPTLVP